MTPNQLSICLLEDFDPDEVQDLANQGLDTDVYHLRQMMGILQGEYPIVRQPIITYWEREPGFLTVNIELSWDTNSTSTWRIATLVYAKGRRLGIEFASGVGISDEMREADIGWVKLAFIVSRKSRTPIKGSHRIEESEDFDPSEVEKLAKSVFKPRRWVMLSASLDPFSEGGVWWDSVNNEMVSVEGSGLWAAAGNRALVYIFKVKPFESYGIDVARVLFDLDMDVNDWNKLDNVEKVATVADMLEYRNLLDQSPVWYTKQELRKLLKGVPVP